MEENSQKWFNAEQSKFSSLISLANITNIGHEEARDVMRKRRGEGEGKGGWAEATPTCLCFSTSPT